MMRGLSKCAELSKENNLKGVWHEILTSDFFHKSVSPGPLSIQLGPFRIFSKIHGDIR